MLSTLLLCGCSRARLPQAAAGTSATPTPQISEAIQVDLHGKPDYALVPPGQATVGLRVFQADISKDQLKLVESGSVVVAKVKRTPDGVELQDAKGKRVLRAKLKKGEPLRFLQADNALVYQVQSSALPMEARNADGGPLGTVSARNGGLEWSDKSKKVKARVASLLHPELALLLPLEKLKPEQRAALALALLTFKLL
jgi:hypothetical protein